MLQVLLHTFVCLFLFFFNFYGIVSNAFNKTLMCFYKNYIQQKSSEQKEMPNRDKFPHEENDLYMHGNFFCVQILSNNNYFAVYLHQFSNLKSLELHTGFKKNNVPGLASIFRSCPMLHTLILNIINDFKTERRVRILKEINFCQSTLHCSIFFLFQNLI